MDSVGDDVPERVLKSLGESRITGVMFSTHTTNLFEALGLNQFRRSFAPAPADDTDSAPRAASKSVHDRLALARHPTIMSMSIQGFATNPMETRGRSCQIIDSDVEESSKSKQS
jgi:hypothetical protein